MDYGLVIISHETDKTFTDESGNQFNKIVPTLDKRANNIVARMTDIIGYARSVTGADGKETTKLFMRGTSRFEAGSRFKYTPDYIDFSYKNLVNAIGEAIDKQAKENGEEYFTDTKQNLYEDTSASLDFDELMKEFQTTISSIPGFNDANNDEETEAAKKFLEFWSPRITEITDKYLGKGKKVGSMNRDQVEQLDLIVSDLKELVSKNS
jgi:metal-dependent amidase/aminoacylase/carboxypeptidase family protein